MPAEGRGQRLAAMALAGLAVVGVVAGFVVTGGPVQARKERRDAIRENDLMALAQQVICLAQDGDGPVPARIAASEGCPFTGRIADPFTGAAYRYEVIDARSWRLCAGFETPPDPATRWGPAMRDNAGCSVHRLPQPVGPHGVAEPGR